MFLTGVHGTMTARHFLPLETGPEATPHSHPYKIEWLCVSSTLNDHGYAVDIAMMEEELALELGALNDQLLNELTFFKDRQPSLENLAVYLHMRLRERARDRGADFSNMEVKIWESPTAWASYHD